MLICAFISLIMSILLGIGDEWCLYATSIIIQITKGAIYTVKNMLLVSVLPYKYFQKMLAFTNLLLIIDLILIPQMTRMVNHFFDGNFSSIQWVFTGISVFSIIICTLEIYIIPYPDFNEKPRPGRRREVSRSVQLPEGPFSSSKVTPYLTSNSSDNAFSN